MTEKPDTAAVLARLKDFQRDTVEYVFRRMYLDADPAKRFLIADEVGLGKTLVARGLIARAIEHLWDRSVRIDIVYICSNADIARQNINRLNVTGEKDFALGSRITLMPLEAARRLDEGKRERERLRFVSFTPGTSFDLKKKGGIGRERALLYHLLTHAWDLRGAARFNVLRGSMSPENFRWRVDRIDPDDLDEQVVEAFSADLSRRPEARRTFEELCEAYPRSDSQPDEDTRARRAVFVGEMRGVLAQTCLRSLQPDLIILDEFQRFRHLLDTENAAGQLANDLFTYQESSAAGVNAARVLLLSATPYKMYTMDHEVDRAAGETLGESHYEDFWRTLRFLEPDGTRIDDCARLFQELRMELYRGTELDRPRVADIKARIEGSLRRVMVRTERLAVTEDRNGMLSEVSPGGVRLEARDLEQYLALQRVSRAVGAGDSLEYWKSGSYILNLMEDYDLKRRFDKARRQPRQSAELATILGTAGAALLPVGDIERYDRVDPGNARLRSLEADTIDQGWWRFLWAPPALPYYQGGGVYGDPKTQQFTKRLVFSCWRVVPKVIASLLSYEAERQMIRSFEKGARNTTEARKRRRGLLTFSRSEGRLTGMPVLGLIYPAAVLARQFDPLTLGRELRSDGRLPTSEAVLMRAKSAITTLLDAALLPSAGGGGPADEWWYWAAPMLLDRAQDASEVDAWFAQTDLATLWAGHGDAARVSEEASLWAEHVAKAREVVRDPSQLGPRPSDLADVLALLAVGGPGVTAFRALARVTGGLGDPSPLDRRRHAAPMAHAFLHLFNLPETMALLRTKGEEHAYWRRVLEYCVEGGLQAVLDEYVHILVESLGLLDKSPTEIAEEVSSEVRRVLSLRTATLKADVINAGETGQQGEAEPLRMRVRFAMRFGTEEEEPEEGGESTRADHVRAAFNSPFWPFVLATTSVGQEGLDFHSYCHAVVHWNLPSNPVDLEQREGRVHRYKGHAVRKNVANAYRTGAITADGPDVWERAFEIARRDRSPGTSDLVPFWITGPGGPARIERHVLALPLSRETARYETLRRGLVLYRMVFGQNRQEDLMTFLLSQFGPDAVERLGHEYRINLSPVPLAPAPVR